MRVGLGKRRWSGRKTDGFVDVVGIVGFSRYGGELVVDGLSVGLGWFVRWSAGECPSIMVSIGRCG